MKTAARDAGARHYTVRAGDTLSGIAEQFYGHAVDWHWLYHVNRAAVSNPNMIFAGQVLRIPHDPPSTVGAQPLPHSGHHNGHTRSHDPGGHAHDPGGHAHDPGGRAHGPAHGRHHRDPAPHYHGRHAEHGRHAQAPHGTLDCHGLERLWRDAGGARWAEHTAASVAMAESGGRQFAVSPSDDIGYWQINAPSWGWRASTDPLTNARSAVYISDDGSNWTPWVTYDTGAYRGRC